jgi:hypothetical protein
MKARNQLNCFAIIVLIGLLAVRQDRGQYRRLQETFSGGQSETNLDEGNHTLTEAHASSENDPNMPYRLPKSAETWCLPIRELPLDYTQCNPLTYVNEIPFLAGLTNGLKFLLLGVISSFEENRCFYVDESHNLLIYRDDPANEVDSLLLRYFEPIGLLKNHSIINQARIDKRFIRQKWQHVWGNVARNMEKRRVYKDMQTVMGYENIDGHDLKKIILQRMWRPLPHVRHAACSTMEQLELNKEYLAFSVRRGDKTLEKVSFTPLQKYTDAAERVIQNHFHGVAPTIFVATDDCSVMSKFRELRSDWKFVSVCDLSTNIQGTRGYHARNMSSWTIQETDAHYQKFFAEVFALSSAKYFLGVSYTNVAWWVFFMRPNRWSFELIDFDQRRKPTSSIVDYW